MIFRAGLALVMGASPLLVDLSPAAASPRLRFDDITKAAGITTARTRTWGAMWSDYDVDGDPDVFLNQHWNDPHLYRNFEARYRLQAERFVELPGYEGPEYYRVDRHGCAWGESNGDGRPDLYCTVGTDSGTSWGPNQLAVPTSPQRFTDRAREYGVSDKYGRGRSVNWLDFDGDADLDLFVANDLRAGTTNLMLRNTGVGFEQATVGVEDQLRSLTSTWADWDDDGDPDLLVTQGQVTGAGSDPAVAYLNLGGTFVRTSLPGITDDAWKSAAWGDFDGDGLPDLHLVKIDRAVIFHNTGGSFEPAHDMSLERGRSSGWIDVENDGNLDLYVVQGATAGPPNQGPNLPDFFLRQSPSDQPGWRRVDHLSFAGRTAGNGDSVAVADHDRDGRQDLFVTNGHNPSDWRGRSSLLRNTTYARLWAGLALHGQRGNPQGIGAKISVVAGPLAYERQVTDAVGYRGQSELGYVHLGLDSAIAATVRIEWPSGATDCVEARAGAIRGVTEGESPCE